MPTHVERDHVIPLLLAQFDNVGRVCDGLDEESWERPTCLPGWSVKDVLSHLYGTEAMLLGEKPPELDVSAFSHVKNSTGQFNELWVESLRSVPGADVLKRFREATARRREQLETMTQEDMDKPSWTPAGADETYGRFMRIRHMDLFLHELDIRDALGLPDPDDAHHISLALEEPEAALGYMVGKKAAMPDGSRIRIHVTGPGERVWHVAVDGKARVVDSFDEEPTAGIRLPALTFLRLAGGRVDAEPLADEQVELEGEPELARQLATRLAYMI